MGHVRDSRALSWLSDPRTDAPNEPPRLSSGPKAVLFRLAIFLLEALLADTS
jgi:hypothetical protein